MKFKFQISKIYAALAARLKKFMLFLGLHAFWVILFLIFIDLLLGGFVFYKYGFLVEKEKPNITENILKFNEKIYNEVLMELQAK